MSDQQAMFNSGDTFIGKYRIVRQIGSGGFGEVYEAESIMLSNRKVAIKVLHAGLTRQDDLVKRFIREAQAIDAINHLHIVGVQEVDQTPEGVVYIIMELLHGEDLESLLQKQPRLTVADTLTILFPVISALSAAHAEGIVHRDLKPENIYISTDPYGNPLVKLLDFGICKFTTGGGQTLTKEGQPGTPGYMSPEQLKNESIDLKTDIWSLGIITYRMLSGKLPFNAETFWTFCNELATAKSVPPLAPEIDAECGEFTGILYKMLALDPAERYGATSDLYNQIVDYSRRQLEGGDDTFAPVMALSDNLNRLSSSGSWNNFPSKAPPPGSDSDAKRAVKAAKEAGDISSSATVPAPQSYVRQFNNTPSDADSEKPNAIPAPAPAKRTPWLPVAVAVAGIAIAVSAFFILSPNDSVDAAPVTSPDTEGKTDDEPVVDGRPTPASPTIEETSAAEDTKTEDAEVTNAAAPNADTSASAESTDADAAAEADADTADATDDKPSKSGKKMSRPTGTFSLDTTPRTTVYWKGRRLGRTPLIKVSLPVGPQTVTMVNRNKNIKETLSVLIRKGQNEKIPLRNLQ